MAHRDTQFSSGSGLCASRILPCGHTYGRQSVSREKTAGQLGLCSTNFLISSTMGFSEPLPEGVLGNLSKQPAFPLVYCSSPCRDKNPWAGSPGFPAFAAIRFAGLSACAFRPTDGRSPVSRVAAGHLRLLSTSFPAGSSYSCLEPLPVRVLGNLSRQPTFPPAYCSSPCGDETPWAGSPGFSAFAEIRFVGLPAHRL